MGCGLLCCNMFRFKMPSIIPIKNDPSALGLLGANVLVLLLAFIFAWRPFEALFLYWCQSIIIGLFAIVRMILSTLMKKSHGPFGKLGSSAGLLFMVPFFIFHFGGFCLVHLLFILAIGVGFNEGSSFSTDLIFSTLFRPEFILAIGAFLLVHAFSLFVNRSELAESSIDQEMMRPYGRVFVMHLSLIFGVFLTIFLGNSIGVLIVFMALKSVLDVQTHVVEHQKISH